MYKIRQRIDGEKATMRVKTSNADAPFAARQTIFNMDLLGGVHETRDDSTSDSLADEDTSASYSLSEDSK